MPDFSVFFEKIGFLKRLLSVLMGVEKGIFEGVF
jgi:hypothetical protein